MLSRILSTVVLWSAVIITLVYGGTDGGVVFLAIIASLAQMEAYHLLRNSGYPPLERVGVIFGVLTVLGSYYAIAPNPGIATSNPWVGLSLAAITAIAMIRAPMERLVPTLLATLFGFILIPFALSFYVAVLIALESGAPDANPLYCVIWIIAVAKFNDVGGLLVGSRIGKTPMAPQLSPRKTIEGAVGGLVFSIVSGILLYVANPSAFPVEFQWHHALLGSAVLGIVAIPSDLLGSALKRNADVKDSGFRIPGIGGLLDLADSLLLTAPVGYFLLLGLLQ